MNEVAPVNIQPIERTFDTPQRERSPLNDVAPSNVAKSDVTFDTSQRAMEHSHFGDSARVQLPRALRSSTPDLGAKPCGMEAQRGSNAVRLLRIERV